MKTRTKKIASITLLALVLLFLSSGCVIISKEMPEPGKIKYKQVVYVENDGRCQPGEVLKVTGGGGTEKAPRKIECVPRPE